MKQSSKVCLNFETGDEIKEVMIKLDNSEIFLFSESEYPVRIKKSIELDSIFQKYPLLLELQKKLGFDVYGEYVVLEGGFKKNFDESIESKFFIGDVIRYKHNDEFRFYLNIYEHTNFNGFGRFRVEEISDAFYVESSIIYCNIIQELSKYYKGEENKFEEVIKVLEI